MLTGNPLHCSPIPLPLTGIVVVDIIDIIDTPIAEINTITIGIKLLTLITEDSLLLKDYDEFAAPLYIM
jgi:hypothetical protein